MKEREKTMEGKQASCGGLPSQVLAPLQSDGGEDQEFESEKKMSVLGQRQFNK